MFEHDKEIVTSLLNENHHFKRLYEKYSSLKNTVREANKRINNTNQLSVERLKKEKLVLKDQMASMIEDYKHGSV